ncbi:DUF3800 domain-containing protein [Nocardia sp. NPDC051750]|uniref:DUF3800 domain-containing protein n=1 Tax=Nocardia sp. NPDC051750 TaxID=3364325 RepID=UPI003790418B
MKDPSDLRLIYVDDSGAEGTGWIVYGWVECSPSEWRRALRAWLELRKRLYADHGVPPSQELHSTKFINGRHRISTNLPQTQWKTLGRAVAVSCLEAIRDCPDIRVGAVYRRTTARGRAYYQEKAATYTALVRRWDAELAATGSFGVVNMDGNGTDRSYFNAHRDLKLDTRHIIEDPMFHDSKTSQWIQAADLVAYAAYIQLNPHSGNKYGADWYNNYLSPSDPEGGPVAL